MEKSLQKAQGRFDKTADAIERRQRQLDRNLANLGREAGNFARPVQLAASVALGAITALSYQAAKRAEAVSGAFDQTFRDMPGQAAAATAKIAEEFGRLETDVKDNFTQLRSVLVALGVEGEQSLAIVDQLQRRSLDIGAFRDVSDAEAFRAVISGITGETEPLKRFGIVVNETAVKAELLRLGFRGNAQEASEAAKAIARSNIIMRQSAEMHGQVAREADSVTEQEKRLRAEFNKAAEDLGRNFLPVAADVLKWASEALKAFNDLPQGVQVAGLALLALVAASGPISAAITGLRALIGAAVAARAALAAVGASSAAGAAAAGGTAGILARTAPLAAGAAAVGIGLGSVAPAPGPNDFVNDPSFVGRRLGESEASWRARGGFTRSEWEARRRRRPAPSPAPSAEADAVLAGLGDFGLSDAQRAGTGIPTGGGSGSAQANADRISAAREALTLELAIAQARATGDQAQIRAAEEREELGRLTQQYEAAGYQDAQARATEHLSLLNRATVLTEEREAAEEQVDRILEGRDRQLEREADYAQALTEQTRDRLAYEAELARLSGNEGAIRNAERRLFIEERSLEILRLRLAASKEEAAVMAGGEWIELDRAEGGREMARGIVDVLRSDNIWEEAGRRFQNAAWDGIENLLSQLLSGKGGDGFDLFGALKGLIPGFSKGVTNFQGGLAYVHKGEVLTNLPRGTSVIPSVNAAMAGMQDAVQVVQAAPPVQFILHSPVVTQDLLDQMNAIGAGAEARAVRTSARIASKAAPQRQQRLARLGT